MKQSLYVHGNTPTLALVMLKSITLLTTGCQEKPSEWKNVPTSSNNPDSGDANLKVKVLATSGADVFRQRAVQDMKAHLEYPADAEFEPGFLEQSAVAIYETGKPDERQRGMLVKGRVSIQDSAGVRRMHDYCVSYLVQMDDQEQPLRKIAVELDHKTIWSDPKYGSE
jgi:hypothetical protein